MGRIAGSIWQSNVPIAISQVSIERMPFCSTSILLQAFNLQSQNILQRVEEIEAKTVGYKAEANARAYLESLREKASTPQEKSSTSGSLLQQLNKFDQTFAKEKKLIALPPDFEPVTAKPLLFDLALEDCEFPNLEERKKSKGWLSFWR